jgi:hypothetical protein
VISTFDPVKSLRLLDDKSHIAVMDFPASLDEPDGVSAGKMYKLEGKAGPFYQADGGAVHIRFRRLLI